jgi:hypothetical protein
LPSRNPKKWVTADLAAIQNRALIPRITEILDSAEVVVVMAEERQFLGVASVEAVVFLVAASIVASVAT